MTELQYTPKEALEKALAVVKECLPELHADLIEAIDRGIDIQQKLPERSGLKRGPKPKDKYFWKREPLGDADALDLVFRGIRAYCVEVPLAMDIAAIEIREASILTEHWGLVTERDEPKNATILEKRVHEYSKTAKNVDIEIETEPEGVREKKDVENYVVPAVNQKKLLNMLEVLEELLKFESTDNGDATRS